MRPARPLRILFIGQAVERKGLPVLLRAFEALRDQIPATLTLVGASAQEVAHMMLDDRGVHALGKVSEERKLAELARADVLCAPSLHGESFGMVLTEAFAAATPVLASDIPGYRDVVRDGLDGLLVPAGDALALAEALRSARARPPLARAHGRSPRASGPSASPGRTSPPKCSTATSRRVGRIARDRARARGGAPRPRSRRPAAAHARRATAELAGGATAAPPARRAAAPPARRCAALASLASSLRSALRSPRWPCSASASARVAASLLASKPGLLAAGLALMCAAMFVRALAWHAILVAAPTWRRAKRRDAMQGTFIGVLMSATLPARLGEPSRALIVARRLGRARETLPVVLGTMVSQTLLNLLALAILGGVDAARASASSTGTTGAAAGRARAARCAARARCSRRCSLPPAARLALATPARAARGALRRSLLRLRDGLRVFADRATRPSPPRRSWGRGRCSGCPAGCC